MPPPFGPCSARPPTRADDAVDVAVATTGRLEPVLAWWSHRASAPLLDRWTGGVRALHEAIARSAPRTVAVDPAVLRNVNTVADLAPPRRGIGSLGSWLRQRSTSRSWPNSWTRGAPVIDVREPDEYTGGHVPGAVSIPLATVPEHLDDFRATMPFT